MDITVCCATNCAHEGAERFRPDRYGSRFSSDGMENLRFGRVTFSTDAAHVQALLNRDRPNTGAGDGEAVGTAAALERTMNRHDSLPTGTTGDTASSAQAVRVVLFTWPSNGQAFPFVSYKSDRGEVAGFSGAVGRGLLKVRDVLHALGREVRSGNRHVAKMRTALEAQGVRTSEIDRVLLCAADVDDDVLEPRKTMEQMH